MCTYKERIEILNKKSSEDKTFVELMGQMNDNIRRWVAADLQELTKASLWTILYNWSNGRTKPLKLQQEAIAHYFETTTEILFPTEKTS